MANNQIPITPGLVTWGRVRAGLSVAEIAQKFPRIEEWEQGKSFPTYPQLEAMAEAFRLPVAVFFFPEPPDVPAIAETFRTLPEAEYERLPSAILLLLRKAKALQLNLAEMTDGHNPAKRLITRDLALDLKQPVSKLARQVRTYLGVTIEQQQAWADDDAALKGWRDALQAVGIFVFKDAFRQDDFSGFCLYDEIFPVIYVNNSSSKTRQMFTLLHELAHLLFHTSGIDTLSDEFIANLDDEKQAIEVRCNAFAAAFLVPEDAFDQAVNGRVASEALAEEMASSFHVSREFVFRRFLDRGQITTAAYADAAKRWAAQQKKGKGGDYYRTKLTYLGRGYVGLALRQYHRNVIDEEQLGEYLDTKPRNLQTLEDYFAEGVA